MLLSRAEVALSKGQLESTDKQEVCPAHSLFLRVPSTLGDKHPRSGHPRRQHPGGWTCLFN